MALNLKIITPEGILFSGDVISINVKTTEGYIGIFPHHMPIIANIVISKMTYKTNERIRTLSVGGGLLITNAHEVRIISDKIEYISVLKEKEKEITKKRIKKIMEG